MVACKVEGLSASADVNFKFKLSQQERDPAVAVELFNTVMQPTSRLGSNDRLTPATARLSDVPVQYPHSGRQLYRCYRRQLKLEQQIDFGVQLESSSTSTLPVVVHTQKQG